MIRHLECAHMVFFEDKAVVQEGGSDQARLRSQSRLALAFDHHLEPAA
jgi:hypothetical protein